MTHRQSERKRSQRKAHAKGQTGNRRDSKGWKDYDNDRGYVGVYVQFVPAESTTTRVPAVCF